MRTHRVSRIQARWLLSGAAGPAVPVPAVVTAVAWFAEQDGAP
jgi:hypothetical protein